MLNVLIFTCEWELVKVAACLLLVHLGSSSYRHHSKHTCVRGVLLISRRLHTSGDCIYTVSGLYFLFLSVQTIPDPVVIGGTLCAEV